MTKKISLSLLSLLIMMLNAQAQQVEMADEFRANGKILVVVGVLLIVLLGIVIYLISIDRKLNRMEKSFKK